MSETRLFDLYGCGEMRKMFGSLLENEVYVTDKTGSKTIEILNASFLANEVALFGRVKEDYLTKELNWYLTEDQNIASMSEPVPALWKSTAGKDGETNSNYGWCVFSEQNGSQYYNTLVELQKNKFSRRAEMIYNRPSMWSDFEADGKNDFMCTNVVQYFIRNNRLEAQVYMRSNDAVFGYKCDRFWQMWVRDKLHRDLLPVYPDLTRGMIMWNVGSLHIYSRHFYLVDHFLKTGIYDISKEEYFTGATSNNS